MGGLTREVPAQVGRSEAPPESGLPRVALAYEVTPLNQSFEQAGVRQKIHYAKIQDLFAPA